MPCVRVSCQTVIHGGSWCEGSSPSFSYHTLVMHPSTVKTGGHVERFREIILFEAWLHWVSWVLESNGLRLRFLGFIALADNLLIMNVQKPDAKRMA